MPVGSSGSDKKRLCLSPADTATSTAHVVQGVDLLHVLEYHVPPETLLRSFWHNLPWQTRSALRSTCKAARRLVDTKLIDSLALTVQNSASFLFGDLVSLLQQLPQLGRLHLYVSKSLESNPVSASKLLIQLLSFMKYCNSVTTVHIAPDGFDFNLHLQRRVFDTLAARLPRLRELEIWNSHITAEVLYGLSNCKQLRSLRLAYGELSGHCLATAVSRLPPLEKLVISSVTSTCGDVGFPLASLQHLTSLSHLELEDIDTSPLQGLTRLQGLTKLVIRGVACGEAGPGEAGPSRHTPPSCCRYLGQLQQLQHLTLYDTMVCRVADLVYLGQLEHLTSLCIYLTRDWDLGLVWQGRQLLRLERLRALQVWGCPRLQDLHCLLHAAAGLESLALGTVSMPAAAEVQEVEVVVEMVRQVAARCAALAMGEHLELMFEQHQRQQQQGQVQQQPGQVQQAQAQAQACLRAMLAALQPLAGSRHLRSMELHGVAVLDSGSAAELVAAVPQLTSLALVDCCLVDAVCLVRIAEGGRLTRLVLRGCGGEVCAAHVLVLAARKPEMELVVEQAGWWTAADSVRLSEVVRHVRQVYGGAQLGGACVCASVPAIASV